tara:strand:- start:230 stop:439 length:210 start_codon:yes stop_codon:yes gene_type:complete
MEPSYKSPAINSFLDSLLPQGRDRVKLIQKDLCVTCLGHAKEFTNELSKREYAISGMCQTCQDKVFGGK